MMVARNNTEVIRACQVISNELVGRSFDENSTWRQKRDLPSE